MASASAVVVATTSLLLGLMNTCVRKPKGSGTRCQPGLGVLNLDRVAVSRLLVQPC